MLLAMRVDIAGSENSLTLHSVLLSCSIENALLSISFRFSPELSFFTANSAFDAEDRSGNLMERRIR